MNGNGKMSFGSYVFPVNPYMLRILHQKTVAEHKIPSYKSLTEETGMSCTRIQGEGEFFGEDAELQFLELKSVFENTGADILYLPSQKPVLAVFESLELSGSDIGGVIRYKFSFVEQTGKDTVRKLTQKTADGRKCLWDYAGESGIPVEILMKLNPDIERPDRPVSAGKQVFLC